ncbi:hypothetical protein [Halostagnicola larsenii]|uniref:hypothetical protein n=1 Tax=Halostagnicola larsenii TaxID=353800 RepID=UPI0012FCB138|nr:hypothetical protein [Halostagnicola larsenii]
MRAKERKENSYYRRSVIATAVTASVTSTVGCIGFLPVSESDDTVVKSAVHIENLDDQPYSFEMVVKNQKNGNNLIDKVVEIGPGPIETKEVNFDTANLDGTVSTTVRLEVQNNGELISAEHSITSDESFQLTISEEGEFEIRMRSP